MRGLLLLSALPVTFLASCGEVLNGVTALSHSHWPFHSNQQSRYKFLSSSAAVCFTAAASVLGGDPKTCNAIEHAELMALAGKEIPRYIDYTLLMKYGYGPGKFGRRMFHV